MSYKIVYLLAILLILPHSNSTQEKQGNNEIIFNYNNTYKYNVPYIVYVSKHMEYIMEFGNDDVLSYDTPARVTVASDSANRTYPLFVTARQQKGVFSWQLPMLVQTPEVLDQFDNVSRTLCPHNNVFDENTDTCDITSQNTPIIHLTSASPTPIEVTITVETVKDFYIKRYSTTNLTTTPSQPKYYFYPFTQDSNLNSIDLNTQAVKRKEVCNFELTNQEEEKLKEVRVREKMALGGESKRVGGWFDKPKSVIVMIESDDDVCALVSIQNFSCPVFDNERDILYDGFYFTMTRRGGITLTQDQFPYGFYIVFIVKTSDEDCIGETVTANSSLIELYQWQSGTDDAVDRVKNFSFIIVPTISYSDYMMAAGAAIAVFVSFYLAAAFPICYYARRRRWSTNEVIIVDRCAVNAEISSQATPHDVSNIESGTRRRMPRSDSRSGPPLGATGRESSSSDTETDVSTIGDIAAERSWEPTRLCVATLARKRPRVISARSKMYVYNILTVSVFYTLPVIQLVITYQRLLNQSGNQDLCYYNFFCAHPLYILSDFNHVLSNLGYVALGALFLLLVWRRHRMHRGKSTTQKQLGIPQHFGLLYAMGVALISEGILSAAYHVCPNSMNFQFDTSFMYVTGVLSMVRLYQARHPDINARAHATLAVLAILISIGLVGVLNPSFTFWVLFTILHLTACFVLTFQIYYMGRFRLDGGTIWRAARQLATRPLAAITPTHCARCVLLLIANLTNWALAAYGVANMSKDFSSHLLLIVMSNLFLYSLFYIAMKLVCREKIAWYSWMFIALTYTTWFSSSYFFLDLSTNWALTPAESRRSNKPCTLLQLYDSHDIWHFLSSIAMFFSFNMYLTIDDLLEGTPREAITVF